MGALGFPEVFMLLVMMGIYLIYAIITPLLLFVALRIFVWFADIFGLPEALGRFAATLVDAFREQRALDQQQCDAAQDLVMSSLTTQV